ncbi:MAG: Na+/H+ antiporter NhaC family protein, partial [Oscillospiraceae bacterium]|nr:Na+/H+ antiporter NhaC family protein [Oscillospiraceae bacterium]
MAAVVLLSLKTGPASQEEPAVYAGIFSLLPPLVAIVLALVTKEVYSALFIGILVGAFLYANGNPEKAFVAMLYHEEAGLIPNLTDISHASVLVFVTILGAIVIILNKSGSAQAFGDWALKRIKTRAGAQLATILMGLMIFVDDGFNCMTVGSVMRPITDRHRISRAKLAYLIDATAAPVCIIAPISCWAAAVTYSVPAEMNINGFQMFLKTIPYNLYALGTLMMLVLLSVSRVEYGPMRRHEINAMNGDLFSVEKGQQYEEKAEPAQKRPVRVSNLLIPVIGLIVICILGILYTGGFFSGVPLATAFSEADSARGLVFGSLITLILTFFLYMSRNVLSFQGFMDCLPAGFRSMCAPMIILILSWNLSGVTGLLGAGEFIHNIVSASADEVKMLLPFLVFLVSVFLAFSTGTSWGTFSILIPIVCAVFQTSPQMLIISISACLAGSVCGDHCSP